MNFFGVCLQTPYFKIVDPAVVQFEDLTGHERVGVINRNTKEKVKTLGLSL